MTNPVVAIARAGRRATAAPAFVLPLLLAAVACEPPPKDFPPPRDRWTLEAPGIVVEVRREPYGVTVRDASGRAVLETAPEPLGDGYAAAAWTTGTVRWSTNPLTAGQYTFRTSLDPWREGLRVVEDRLDGDALVLVVEPASFGDGAPTERATIRHALRDSTLRVEIEVEGVAPRAVAAAFRSPPDEGFLGLGERFTRTDYRGVTVYSWAEEGGVGTGEGDPVGPANPAPNGESMTYYPVPFFVSTGGYAFWLDSTWRNELELASVREDQWRAWHIGPSLAYEVYVPIPDDPRPWPYHLIDLFTAATGRPMVPPAWTFGPRRRVGRNSTVEGVAEVRAMRDEDLAVTAVDDAVHFLPHGSHVGAEEDLAAWTDAAHDLGYRVNCYFNSLLGAAPDSRLRPVVEEGLENGWFLRDERGVPLEVMLISGSLQTVYQIDFTAPGAAEWFQSMLLWAVDLGYDGFMYDFGEYVQADALSASGMTGEELHNLYPVQYQRAGYEGLEASAIAGEWLFFARSGYTGTQAWAPMIWSGDPAASFESSDGLPSMVRAAINMGVSGSPNWGGDIGGFHCVADGHAAADGELLTRWIQQGSMTPNMQDQNACALATDEGEKASIWSSPDALEAWRRYARLHTRLFPYFWALAAEAHATGAPHVRHLFLEHPDRPDLRGVDDTHYLGRALLVAPVVERGARQRDVPFPDGLYLSWDTHELVEGGATRAVDAPLDRLPLFLRDGHLVVLLDPSIDTLSREDHPEVVGPADVADVYDVVGLLSAEAGEATFVLADGGRLEATNAGAVAAPDLPAAPDEASLAACTGGCYRLDEVSDRVTRLRVTTSAAELGAGGVTLRAAGVGRRVRWDLFLVE
jgi:alpha-D-xyloside xylohydrolase